MSVGKLFKRIAFQIGSKLPNNLVSLLSLSGVTKTPLALFDIILISLILIISGLNKFSKCVVYIILEFRFLESSFNKHNNSL